MVFIGSSIFTFIGIILCIYACIKDVQKNNILWAILDIVFFPVGVVRAFLHLLR